MANQLVAEMFKTSDLDPTDKLYTKKKDCLDEVKRLFTTNLNYTYSRKYYENEQGEDTGLRNYQAEKSHDESQSRNHLQGRYCEPIFLQPHQVAYALEERKALIKWILTKAPWMNVPVAKPNWNAYIASVDTGELTDDGSKKYCKITVNPAQIIRERDWLFGTNDTPIVTMANYREKVRAAQTAEEVKHLKQLLFNPLWDTRNPLFNERTADAMEKSLQKEREETNEFLDGVKNHVRNMLRQMSCINREINRYNWTDEEKRSGSRVKSWNAEITGPLGRLETMNDTTESGRQALLQKKVGADTLRLHADMKWSLWVGYELLKNDEQYLNWDSKLLGNTFNGLTYTLAKARTELARRGATYHWKPEPTKPNLDPVSPLPPPTKQSESQPTPNLPDNSEPTEDNYQGTTDIPTAPLSEEEVTTKLAEVKKKLAQVEPVVKGQGSQSPQEAHQTLSQLERQLKQLEDSNAPWSTIAELKEKITGLSKQLADTAPILVSIQEFFAKNASVLEAVQQYFQKYNVKLIKLVGAEWIIEYNDNKATAMVATDSLPELQEVQGFLQTASKKELTSQEVLSIGNDSSSPANSPSNKGLYIIGAIIFVVVVGGVIIFWRWNSKKEKKY